MKLPHPPLLVISDRHQARRPIPVIAEMAFNAGCRWFSLREKDLPAAERLALLRQLVALGNGYRAIVMAHDDVEGVAAAAASGVHLPGGADPGAARRRLPQALIGASAHSAAEAAALLRAGADYATISPIFLTDSKPSYGPAIGLDGLAATAAAAAGAIVALGGIRPARTRDCLAAGAAGIAVMGEIMRAEDPAAAVAAFLAALGNT